MKNSIKLISGVFIIAFIIILMSVVVNAGKVTSATYSKIPSGIKVSGKAEDSVSAVAISVFNEDGSKLIMIKTTSVGDDNSFSEEIAVPNGKCIVKIADYSGGDYYKVENVVENSVTDEKTDSDIDNKEENNRTEEKTEEKVKDKDGKSSNPKTGDNIVWVAIIFGIALFGMAIMMVYNKRNKKTSKH